MASSKDAVVLDVDGHEVRVSNPEKPYFADKGIRKIDVVEYFVAVGEGILFALQDRPTTLERWPGGVFEGARISTRVDNTGDAFYQKRVPEERPEWVPTAHITFPSGRTADEIAPDSVAVVAWCANLGTLTFHPWPVDKADVESPEPDPHRPRPAAGHRLLRRRVGGPARAGAAARVRHGGLAEDLRRPRRAHLRADPAAVDLHRGAARGHRVRPRAGTPAPRPRDDVVVEGGARREDLHRLQPDGPGPHDRLGVLHPAQAARAGVRTASTGTSCPTSTPLRLRRPHHAGAVRGGRRQARRPGRPRLRHRAAARAGREAGNATPAWATCPIRRTTRRCPASRCGCSPAAPGSRPAKTPDRSRGRQTPGGPPKAASAALAMAPTSSSLVLRDHHHGAHGGQATERRPAGRRRHAPDRRRAGTGRRR